MHEDRPAFGQRLAELAEIGVIEFRPEPLDDIESSGVSKRAGKSDLVRSAMQIASMLSTALIASGVVDVTGKPFVFGLDR